MGKADPPQTTDRARASELLSSMKSGRLRWQDLEEVDRDRLTTSLFLMGASVASIAETIGISSTRIRTRLKRFLVKEGTDLLALPLEAIAATTFGRLEDLYERAIRAGDLSTARAVVGDVWRMSQDLSRVPKAPLHAIVDDRRTLTISVEERTKKIAHFLERARVSGLTIPGLPAHDGGNGDARPGPSLEPRLPDLEVDPDRGPGDGEDRDEAGPRSA